MDKIALITDSASDISTEDLNKYNIKLLPFKIIFSDKEYDDKLEITPEFLYESLSREIPKTSLPSIERLTNTLKEAINEGCTHAIIITISSELSGTYNSIRLACESIDEIETFVYDSKTLSMAEGAIVLETAKLIEEGKSFDEIINIIPTFTPKINIFFTIDTLEYLKKGGRIGKVAGTIGEVLNLKPIITVGDDGIYHTYCKVRGKKQSLSKMVEILKSCVSEGKFRVWIMNGNGLEQAKALFEAVKDLKTISECYLGGTIGPALGVHTGPGLLGFITEKVD